MLQLAAPAERVRPALVAERRGAGYNRTQVSLGVSAEGRAESRPLGPIRVMPGRKANRLFASLPRSPPHRSTHTKGSADDADGSRSPGNYHQ